jgi:peptidoglycan/xylan/chitin deacetylase (PgdA/CDA1 family)
VWNVRLAQPFAANRLARDQRSLCLLVERASSGGVVGQLCVTGPAPRSYQPRLVYMAVSGQRTGPGRVIAAAVRRPSSSSLMASFLPAAIGRGYGELRWQVISTLRGAACAPPAPGSGCFELYPARPTLLSLHEPVLVGCLPSGPALVFHGSSRIHELALTFDDGPWDQPPTADFLALLEREHVPATFFEIGDQISEFDRSGALERRMLADGDMIGVHTWNHPVMTGLPVVQQRIQLLNTAEAIRRATRGFQPCLWRPPYGAINPSLVSLARSLGMLTIMWDVDPRDWSLPGVGAIYSNVVGHAHNGAIILQHFGGGPRYQTLAALPEEIRTLRARGYRFVTVSQLLGLRLVYR